MLVELLKYVSEFFLVHTPFGEHRAVFLSKRADEGIAVLFANLAVFVAVAIVEAGLFHVVPSYFKRGTGGAGLGSALPNKHAQDETDDRV
jgi:hypothetical protein